jgi:LCP family protein required for cell wall assembly
VSAGRIHRAPLFLVALIIVLVGIGGGAGVYLAADRREAGVQRVDVGHALSNDDANERPAENYLIVGSDSRENFDPENSGEGGCNCSDTIMVLRRDPDHGAALLSLPRDLWVTIADGHGNHKINAAYSFGPEVLIRTITEELGLPIDHYVEIDFAGFVTLVDAIGGVEVCVEHLAQDNNTGMLLQPGCQIVNGEGGLSYARSRYYEEFIDGEWVPDNKVDLGRIERQQAFVRSAVSALRREVVANPERLGDLVEEAGNAVTFDAGADLFSAGQALAAAAGEGLHTFSLPVSELVVSGQSALELEDGAETILDYFRGSSPLPPPAAEASEAPG